MRQRLLIAIIILLMPWTLAAQQSGSLPSAAKTENDSLGPVRGWVGQWQCSGTALATSGGPSHSYTYRMRVAPALLSHWLEFTIILTPTGSRSPAVEGKDFWGQDPATGELVELFLDSHGTYGQGRIDLLTEARVHYRGKGGGEPEEPYYDVSFEFEKPRKLHIRWQGSADGQTWKPRTEDRCQKILSRR